MFECFSFFVVVEAGNLPQQSSILSIFLSYYCTYFFGWQWPEWNKLVYSSLDEIFLVLLRLIVAIGF